MGLIGDVGIILGSLPESVNVRGEEQALCLLLKGKAKPSVERAPGASCVSDSPAACCTAGSREAHCC